MRCPSGRKGGRGGLPGETPVTDFRQTQATRTYSGGTVRDSHPVILFSIPGSSPVIPRKPLSSCLVYSTTRRQTCQECTPNWDLSNSQHRTSLPSPGEKVAERQRGRMWNAGSNLNCGTRPRLLNMLPNHRPETDTKPQHFRPHSTSVTEIGSEEPISVPASPREKPRRPAAAVAPKVRHISKPNSTRN